MTQVRETLGIMDGGPPSLTFAMKSKKGVHVSRTLALLFTAIYAISIIATGLLVYNFAACPHINFATDVSDIECNDSITEEVKMHMPKAEHTSVATVSPSENVPKPNVRLPKSVKPIRYNIKLLPFIFEGNFTFNGEVSILIKAIESTNNITLHAADLSILKTEVLSVNESNSHLKIIGYSNDTEKQFHIIHLKNNMKDGYYYQINMEFKGRLNDNLHGFYRSSYTVDNKTRWIGTSQFQPTDARRAFPCFDEPAMKARFIISIAHPKNMTAISNMDSTGVQDPVEGLQDYVWEHFRESLPMSTYLVAFVISDFANKSDGNFRVWARRDAIESANYALDIGPKILKYFEEFYQIKYPLPKIDMVALPDFNAGAMENWGLMTYRESVMLFEEDVSAKINKPRIATVVAHELAHQWFGNLVTPSWWSDLWLNEGFATYVEYVGVDAVEKSWKSMDQFVIHEVQNVFSLDALASSHQISVEVGNPDEIIDIFDRISYGKGAAIIRMMDHFLTSKVFNKGITNYLNKKKYESAEQNDLWKALTDQAREDNVFDETMSVAEIMDTWTLQTGFPVVNVTRDYETDSMKFHQERFVLMSDDNDVKSSKETNKPLWWIPITYTTKSIADFNNTKPVEWMRLQRDLTMSQTNVSFDEWIIVNVQQTGFYRVNYDERNWNMIITHINDPSSFQDISISNRAQILDDALNLALSGKLSYKIALDATKYLVHEREFVPWKAGLASLGYIDSMFSKGPHYLDYQKYIVSLIEGIYNDVGFVDLPDDEMLTVYKRIDVVNIACLMEHENCVKQAVTHFQNWMMSPNPDIHNPISPNFRNTVYCTALRVGGALEWHFLLERFARAHTGSERELLLTALGCTRLPWLLVRYLDLSCRNDSGIRKQDVYRVFGAVSNSVIGQPIAFSFIRQNWRRLKNYLGSSPINLNTIVKYSTRRLNNQYELDELKRFSANTRGELGRIIEQAIEKTEANIVWMSKNYDTIVKWLNELKSSS